MKIQNIQLSLVAAALLVWTAGCEKKETTAQDQMKEATAETSDALKKTAESVKEAGQKAASDVAEQAKAAAAPLNAKAQEIIDSAKRLVGEAKFQEALTKLKELASEKLSAEQQTMVDNLKAQIQKALAATSKTATDAAGAAGNLLKK